MINKIFKTFHSEIENDITASLGDFAIEESAFLRNNSSENVALIFRRTAKRAFDFWFALAFLATSLSAVIRHRHSRQIDLKRAGFFQAGENRIPWQILPDLEIQNHVPAEFRK